MAKYILSDPNFSDGTHSEVIEKIIDQFRGRPGVKLIGYEPDPDFDRLPAELLGRPEAMKEALLDAAGAAYELIDMEKQRGRHPRIGAVDTIEIYPAKDITIEECRDFAEGLGRELFKRYAVPIYFTGKNARKLADDVKKHARGHLPALESLHVELVPASGRERPEHRPEAEREHHH